MVPTRIWAEYPLTILVKVDGEWYELLTEQKSHRRGYKIVELDARFPGQVTVENYANQGERAVLESHTDDPEVVRVWERFLALGRKADGLIRKGDTLEDIEQRVQEREKRRKKQEAKRGS